MSSAGAISAMISAYNNNLRAKKKRRNSDGKWNISLENLRNRKLSAKEKQRLIESVKQERARKLKRLIATYLLVSILVFVSFWAWYFFL